MPIAAGPRLSSLATSGAKPAKAPRSMKVIPEAATSRPAIVHRYVPGKQLSSGERARGLPLIKLSSVCSSAKLPVGCHSQQEQCFLGTVVPGSDTHDPSGIFACCDLAAKLPGGPDQLLDLKYYVGRGLPMER